MNETKPLGESRDAKENQRETYYKNILKTAEQRESVSESLLKDLGINNARDFVNKACKVAKTAKYHIEELKDNESISLKVLQLQDYVLGFRFEDNKNGCDAKLGPITYNALLEKFPVLKEHVEKRRAELKNKKDIRRDLASNSNLPGALPRPKPEEDKKKKPERLREAVQGGEFIERWNYIRNINDPNQLLGMKDSIELKSNDRIVRIPDEGGMRLREGAALRYALFKQYARLKGYEIALSSSYRSAAVQARLWNAGLARRLKKYNGDYKRALAENRRYVAPPGRSHHNTGGAVDIRITRTPDRRSISMKKFTGSGADMERGLQGNMAGLSNADISAVETRRFLDEELRATHFLGSNYHAENWHWNIDEKRVYRNV